MQPLDETLVNVLWAKASEAAPEATLAAMQAFQKAQPDLFQWLVTPAPEPSERALEVILYLAVVTIGVVEGRRYPQGPAAIPAVEETLVARRAQKRRETVESFLLGKQATALPLPGALERLVTEFDLPQLPLLGHATEALLVAYDEEDLSREEAVFSFVRLLVLIDCLDQVVKS